MADTESRHNNNSSGTFAIGTGLERHIRINSTPIREGLSDSPNVGSRLFTYTDEKEVFSSSSKDQPTKLLMFHGVILRSQLTVLLKHKVFFDENDKVTLITIAIDLVVTL